MIHYPHGRAAFLGAASCMNEAASEFQERAMHYESAVVVDTDNDFPLGSHHMETDMVGLVSKEGPFYPFL